MEVLREEKLFTYIPTCEEIEEILESAPNTKINIANTKTACFASELDHLICFGEHICGVNITIDVGDEEECEALRAFPNLQYLRLKFASDTFSIDGYGAFLGWLINADELQCISLDALPNDEWEGIDLLVNTFSLNKKMPVSFFIKNRKKGRLKLNYETNFHNIPMLQVFTVREIELSKQGLQRQAVSTDCIKDIEAIELLYSGEIEIEDNDWQLHAKKLNVRHNEEIVFIFEGRDDAGHFSCEGRCYWKEVEGGFYFAARVPIVYRDYPNDNEDYCSIKISDISISRDGECNLSGEWLQNKYIWKFDGVLRKRHS
ncbi:hypothetical protein ACVBIL_02400 [Shewanella sp. 125m-7]